MTATMAAGMTVTAEVVRVAEAVTTAVAIVAAIVAATTAAIAAATVVIVTGATAMPASAAVATVATARRVHVATGTLLLRINALNNRETVFWRGVKNFFRRKDGNGTVSDGSNTERFGGDTSPQSSAFQRRRTRSHTTRLAVAAVSAFRGRTTERPGGA